MRFDFALGPWQFTGMSRSSSAPATGPVRPELEPLVRQLAALPSAVRHSVVSAAEEAAAESKPVLPWDEFDRAHGIVQLGGDALADCDALYDGT